MSDPDGASPRDEADWQVDDEDEPGPAPEVDKSAHVRTLESLLKAPDAIMEPDILQVLADYLQSVPYSASTAADVIRFLEEGYEGYAHMGSLVCSWLRYVDVEENEEDGKNEKNSKNDVDDNDRSAAVRNKRQRVALTNSAVSPKAQDAAGAGAAEAVPADEASFLRELVLEKFKPSTFENLFTTGGTGPPRWLNALVSEEGGRELIYQLSTKYDDSLLLSFALKKIVSNGFGEEVAGKDVDLSRYFDVFHSILMVRLRSLASTNDEAEIKRLCTLIQRSALSSMLGYVHVRQVLTRLAADGDREGKPWSGRFRRMYQDLETASKDGLACKMSRCFTPVGKDEAENNVSFLAASVIGDVLALASGGHDAPTSDVIKLQRIYSGIIDVGENDASNGTGKLPSVTLLHHPVMVEAMLRSLFNPLKKLRGDALEAHAFLLSVAVCGVDGAGAGGNVDDVGGEDTSQSFAEQPNVARLMQSIKVTVSLGYKATDDTALTQEERQQVDASMAEGICATGVLVLLRKKLTGATDYWGSFHVNKEPPFLSMLFSIVEKQPTMHAEVLALIQDALQSAGNSTAGTDIVVSLARVLIELCKTDMLEDILSWAVGWVRNANAEVSRALILGLLEIAAPPYSDLFAESLIRIMNAADLRRQTMGSRLWNQNLGLVREFCDNFNANLTLDRGEANYLRDLKHATLS